MVTGTQGGGERMPVDFRAYAADATLDGTLFLAGGRLADYLEATPEIEIHDVVLRALDDGRTHRLPSATIGVEELCLAVAAGSRGRADRRIRTRPFPVRATTGAYSVIGYFHAATTADPLVVARRRAIIALSPGTVHYSVAGEAIEEAHPTLLLIQANVTRLQPATDADVGLAKGLDYFNAVDPQAKDFTGAIKAPEEEAEGDR